MDDSSSIGQSIQEQPIVSKEYRISVFDCHVVHNGLIFVPDKYVSLIAFSGVTADLMVQNTSNFGSFFILPLSWKS